MPYLPRPYTHDTLFPEAYDRDLRTQIDLIEEQATRFFPRIPYYCILKTVGISTVDPVTGGPAPTGAAGQNTFDELYGEIVDPALAGQAWKQPHRDGVLAAGVEVERYADPIEFNARVQREMKDYDLKKFGFDEMRDLLLHVPSSILDRRGITSTAGDKFIWNGEEYSVLQAKESGYWKNTNLRLWVSIMAEHKRRGA